MTITVFNATFADGNGGKFHGSISSDKHTPKRLDATLCPHITEHEVDYPIWTAHAAKGREGMLLLIDKMKRKAKTLRWRLVAEAETRYASIDPSSN